MNDPSCIFCKIVAGQIPCLRLFEDEAALAFLDIGPLAEGHVLLIPKQHYARLEEMTGEEVATVSRHLPTLARAVIKATGAVGYNVLQNNGKESGQAVAHVHFHVIPRVAADGLGYRWNATKYAPGRAEQVHKALLEALKS
jgi:histidine triad (HIT) family protein